MDGAPLEEREIARTIPATLHIGSLTIYNSFKFRQFATILTGVWENSPPKHGVNRRFIDTIYDTAS